MAYFNWNANKGGGRISKGGGICNAQILRPTKKSE